MTRPLTVFICSTIADLSAERGAVLEALDRLPIQHGSMEFFGARSQQPIDTCLDEVRRSDVLVVIVGQRYGELVPELGISFSEAEYNEGYRLKKTCLVYILDDEVPVLPKFVERDLYKAQQLERWKQTLRSRHTVVTFKTEQRLALQVAADLGRELYENRNVTRVVENTPVSSGKEQIGTVDTLFRAAGPSTPAELGLLHKLPGRWVGTGFNLIARPARQGIPTNPAFFLELNATQETLEFTAIGGDIPNRGQIEPTALLHAVHYLQSVTDCATHTAIHKEPGLWVHVPKTAEDRSETYVRQAAIPHGASLLAQSTFFTTVASGPAIKPVNSYPFPVVDQIPHLNGDPANPLSSPYIDPYLLCNLPTECVRQSLDAAATIKDPTEVLRAEIKGQNIMMTDVIVVSTTLPEEEKEESPGGGGILNIPFVVKNANAVQMDAIFWIETVKHAYGRIYFQLQYVQRVILDFHNVHWPHISVATLIKE